VRWSWLGVAAGSTIEPQPLSEAEWWVLRRLYCRPRVPALPGFPSRAVEWKPQRPANNRRLVSPPERAMIAPRSGLLARAHIADGQPAAESSRIRQKTRGMFRPR